MTTQTDAIYGNVKVNSNVQLLLNSLPLQRLKNVHQNGAVFLLNKSIHTTRYDHSFGVYALLQKIGASEEEQLAGLLHDISHTAFSHVADAVFGSADEDYHERILEHYVKSAKLSGIISSLGYDPDRIFDTSNFSYLESELPALCADRIDYCLRDCLANNLLPKDAAIKIINGLMTEDGSIVSIDEEHAILCASTFIKLNTEIFFRKEYESINVLLSELLKKALNARVIKEEDFISLGDKEILGKISQSQFSNELAKLPGFTSVDEVPSGKYTVKRKLRLVDPLIAGVHKPLSQVNKVFKATLDSINKSIPLNVRYNINYGDEK